MRRLGLLFIAMAACLGPQDDPSQVHDLRVIGVNFEPPEREGPVMVDPALVRRLVDTLVDNATRYSRPGGTVKVSAAVDHGHAVLEVSDRGVGIPEEERQRVFERFANPWIEHRLADIALAHEAKLAARLAPTLAEYQTRFGKSPPLLAELLTAQR